MKFTIDRIEGHFAVAELENGATENVPLAILPHGVREGDVIHITIDKRETKSRKDEISRLEDELFE